VEEIDRDPEHAATRRLTGAPQRLASVLAVALSLSALYWVLFIVQPQVYRVSFLLIALILTFLLFPATRRSRQPGVPPADWILVAAVVVALGWPLADFGQFVYRAAEPLPIDVILGSITILLVLEAARRAIGWVLPGTAVAFLAYAWLGPAFDRIGLSLIAHRGYGLDRVIGTLYMSLEGLFGVPLDVTATYIILFTIYGAVLEQSGAGRFFIDWALSASGKSVAAPGRSVTIAGFLLGTVSGSGVATTVMLGSVAWPLLRRAGYSAETAGAMLSAAGIGALLSPPTLGAAAFLIAEFLQISYLQVLVMATIPTILYYLSIVLMIEADSKKGTVTFSAPDSEKGTVTFSVSDGPRDPVTLDPRLSDANLKVTVPFSGPAGAKGDCPLMRRYWYHFISLVAIAGFMVAGLSAFRAVFWSTLLAVALSYIRRETALTPPRLVEVLRIGGRDVLGVAATTATAGIIVGVVTLTGLGLKLAGVIVAMAGGALTLTVIYSAVAVWLLGLAVPVTASYIIAAVMVAPALVQAGVPDFAAHMFIFYYAVLSEVSPPTALSPFAAAALTGGNPFRTMLLTWKYTLPAFVVPFVFTLTSRGRGLLLRGSPSDVIIATLTAAAGIAGLSAGISGWVRGPLTLVERTLCCAAGGLFLYGTTASALCGSGAATVVFILQFFEYSRPGQTATRR
jgi:TRAP transporter 4TM/12TM fusion protein